jgi:catechol 2,3-dioxygenase-like lactoylglutathione lyase family enzyme
MSPIPVHPPIDQQITFLRVNDLEATAHFYEQVMGLSLFLDQGVCRIYRVTSNSFVGFCKQTEAMRADPANGPAALIFTLVTEDVDGWYRYLQERGVQLEKAPAYNPNYKIYHCFLRDPDGYLIEIQRFEDPRWQP